MKPFILITNDDGVYSPGLAAVVEAVADLADILVAAPHTQQTSMGRAFPRIQDLGKIETVFLETGKKGQKQKAYGVHGSPSYAVAYGVLELAKRKPDLCISGINYGENLGMTQTCSGTVGAVIEAVSHGIPGIAVSLEVEIDHQRENEFLKMDWSTPKAVVRKWCKLFLEKGMEPGVDFLNINIPAGMKNPEIFRRTTMSRQNYFIFQKPERPSLEEPCGMPVIRRVELATLEPESDIYAVYVDKVISVTPMTCNMTARPG